MPPCLALSQSCSRWPAVNRNGPQMTMQRKLDRTIAVLEVEAKMLEAHAEKFSIMARQLADPEHQREIIKWSPAKTERAEARKSARELTLIVQNPPPHRGPRHVAQRAQMNA